MDKRMDIYNDSSDANFLRWMKPVIIALKEIGRHATPSEVRARIIINEKLSDEVINETRGKTNQNKFENQVAWARQYLVWGGFLDDSIRGKWGLTEKGKTVELTDEMVAQIFKESNKKNFEKKKQAEYEDVSKDNTSKKVLNAFQAINMFEEYEKQNLKPWRAEAEKRRERFVEKYPVDKINGLSIEEYCMGEDSYTKKIRIDLQGLASMGNAYPDTFGLYVKKDTNEIVLSKTFQRISNGDVDIAFKKIKQEITKLLTGFSNDGFEAVRNLNLNNMYIYKLLNIYYPDKVFPVCARGTLQQYCECVGLSFNPKSEMFLGIQAIMNWKDKVKAFNDWDNSRLMSFCDWLVRSNYIINGSELLEFYWPSREEYDPGISTDQWIEVLSDPDVTYENNLLMLAMMFDYGRPATCTELAEKYGQNKNFFNAGSSALAKRVSTKTGCPLPPDRINENARWWPILYVGRDATKEENGSYVWKLRDELKEALAQMDLPLIKDIKEMNNTEIGSLNTILYGPPGTGKTYNSILYAVAICEGSSIEELQAEEYSDVIERFNKLRNEGRIAFTTFHQSYGYEEFIEGIKPIVDDSEDDDGDIRYSVEDGIFKKFCERASLPISSTKAADNYGLNKNPVVWKVSLEGTGDNPTRTECLENDHIRIGWDRYGEVITDDTEFTNGGRIVLNSFINKMQVGDLVLSCYSASTIDAIGVVTGDYEWHPEYSAHKRLRNVRWLAKNIKYNIIELNRNTSMTLSTVYKMKLTVADVFKILDEVGFSESSSSKSDDKPYVFIIDEINRGNISKIFGELITLIEPSKRIGKAEELRVELPYSKKQFGVPDNVYILGTMNTADRSIALMDTALRRRFQFVEMMPDIEVLKNISVEQDGESLDIAKMLEIINLRIEYLYDREHTIGHAYFMSLLSDPSIEKLAEIFDNNLIPLLKEYFYEDYGKIQMVLGDNKKSSDDLKFIKETKLVTKDIFNGDTSELDLPEQIYSIQKEALYNIRSYKEISKDL